jgi:hypothetical protein
MKTTRTTLFTSLFLTCAAAQVHSAMIDFEAINMALPFEGLAISNQFQAHYGLRIHRRSSSDDFPVVARVGPPMAAFEVHNGPDDTLKGTNAFISGSFFLTDSAGGGSGNGIVLIFDGPVSQAGGRILDIDGGEKVTVVAFTDVQGLLPAESLVLAEGMPEAGDGIATPWSFTRQTKDIRRIEIQSVNETSGTPNQVKVGYDNFFSDYTPLNPTPAVLTLEEFAGITLVGQVGRPYRIEYTEDVSGTNWQIVTNIFLPTSPYLFVDTARTTATPQRFYRAIGMQ